MGAHEEGIDVEELRAGRLILGVIQAHQGVP
jgi:hypothetical protein